MKAKIALLAAILIEAAWLLCTIGQTNPAVWSNERDIHHTQIVNAGSAAFWAGVSAEANPYNSFSYPTERNLWLRGWMEQGMKAFRLGVPAEANPYGDGLGSTPNSRALWLDGWMRAKGEEVER